MPPDMFLNCNEEIKRKKEQTIVSLNMQLGRICSWAGSGSGPGSGPEPGPGKRGQEQGAFEGWLELETVDSASSELTSRRQNRIIPWICTPTFGGTSGC